MTKKPLPQYIVSTALTLLAVAIQYLVIRRAHVVVPGLLYPVTFLIAWYFGFRHALLSIAISLICSNLFFYEPTFSFKILKFQDAVRISIFAVTSLMSAWIVARGRQAERSELKTKHALTELEDRFRRSSTATNLGIWYCNLPFNELVWNKECKSHFWLPEDAKVTIDLFYERIHPEDRQKTKEAIESSIQNNIPYDIMYRTTNPSDPNQFKFIRALGWTEYNKNGAPIRFDGITLDNTELHHISRERDESLEVQETLNRVGQTLSAELDTKKLVQTVTDAATQLSKAEFGAFFYNLVNEKGESYTLYTISGVPKENFTKFPMPRNTQIFAPTFKGTSVIRSDDITADPRYGKNAPYRGMPEGHLPVVSYLAVPVISRSGEVIGGLFLGHRKKGIFTEREERIVTGLASQTAIAMDNARLYDQANQAIQMRDEFLSISSHELRTPLTPLKMQIQSLARHIDKDTFKDLGPENLKKMISVADKQVNRITALVDDLLDVSRIASGKLNLNLEEIDLSLLIKEVIERFQYQIQNSKSEVILKLPEKLIAKLDKLRMEQVIINLLTNALKYAPGTPVTISLSHTDGEALIKVSDEGPGIPDTEQSRIFDRFERVNSESSQTGLGLGLYIVKQIITAHKGTINVLSSPGKGSEFNLTLPVEGN